MTFSLTASAITRVYLYGSTITPSLLTDRLRDVDSNYRGSVSIDTNSYLDSYLGKYIVAARFSAVQAFFYKFEDLAPGRYTTEQIVGVSGPVAISFSHEQARLDVNNNNYIERSYILGHETFSMSNNAVFIVESDGTRRIESLQYIIASDNFDFESNGAAQYLNDYVLKPQIDPYEIGRRVDINYTGLASSRSYTETDFARDITSTIEWDSSSSATVYASIALGIEQLKNEMEQEGVYEYYSPSRTVVYGSMQDDTLSYLDALYQRAPFVFVAGAGDDTIQAGVSDDTIYGGAGDDRILASAGNDTMFGGYELEKASVADFDTADYSAVSKPISIKWDGTSSLKVQDGLGGVDTLHAIERIVGTTGRDTLTIKGLIAAGTDLTIDANGGQSPNPRDTINASEAGAGGVSIVIDATSGTGYVRSASTGGQINFIGFHTGIIGSDFDDQITDQSTGHKEIMAGKGNDIVEVGVGSAVIDGGDGDDQLRGGDGNDVLVGGDGTNILAGGAGADLIISSSVFYGYQMYNSDVGDVIDGGDGHDWIKLQGSGRSVRGGTGNDVIDPTDGVVQTVYFRSGDGHDTILHSDSYSLSVHIEDVSLLDVTFLFEVRNAYYQSDNDDSTLPPLYILEGDLVVRLNTTGDMILIPAQSIRRYQDAATGDPTYYVTSWSDYNLSFADGTIADWQYQNNTGLFDFGTSRIVFADVSEYRTAAADFRAAVATDANIAGSAGNDDLSGSANDDNYEAGGGDDVIEASSGSDTIDGGAGEDEIVLLGSAADYQFKHNADGSTTVTSVGGWITGTEFCNVEMVRFLAGDELIGVADLFTGAGTDGDDLLNGTNGNDVVTALAGDDRITGGRGDDLIDGGDGVDTAIFTGASGSYTAYRSEDGSIEVEASDGVDGYDTLVGVEWLEFLGDGIRIAVADVPVSGTSDNDTIIGTALIDDLYGDDGDDVLAGMGGSDTLDGGAGDDIMTGGEGNDTYFIEDAGDIVIEAANEGVDQIFSSTTDYSLPANVEHLTLSYRGSVNGTGNALDNRIIGNFYDNRLEGLEGDDTLNGNGGSDILIGGTGFDVVEFNYSSTDYSIRKDMEGTVIVEELYSSQVSTLTSVERIRFLGDTMDINTDDISVTGLSRTWSNDQQVNSAMWELYREPLMVTDFMLV